MKKKIGILLVLLLVLSTSFTYASNDLFDEYGIRKNFLQRRSSENIVELEEKFDIPIDKEWTVSFNKQVKLEDIFAMSIRKDGELIPVYIDISGDKEAKITPVYHYDYDSPYSINISLMNGNQYKMNFNTVVNPLSQEDTTAPKVLEVRSLSPYVVLIDFNEVVDLDSLKCKIYEKATGSKLEIYEIGYTSENGILITTDDQDSRKEYELLIEQVADLAGNKMKSKSFVFKGTSYDESDLGFSRYNPFKRGWNYGLVSTIRNERYSYNMGVYDIIRGDAASKHIKDMNRFNDDPAPGREYILAEIFFELHESDTGEFDLSPYNFDAVSENGVTYNSTYIAFDDRYFEEFDRKIYEGAVFRGWLAFEVDKNDKYPLLLWMDDVWFELY